MFTEIFCVVTGKVQRVGYRDFVEHVAREHGVVGWVRNHDDGVVEVLLQGYPDILKVCIEDLQRGSVLARVDGVAVDWRTPQKQFDSFAVIA